MHLWIFSLVTLLTFALNFSTAFPTDADALQLELSRPRARLERRNPGPLTSRDNDNTKDVSGVATSLDSMANSSVTTSRNGTLGRSSVTVEYHDTTGPSPSDLRGLMNLVMESIKSEIKSGGTLKPVNPAGTSISWLRSQEFGIRPIEPYQLNYGEASDIVQTIMSELDKTSWSRRFTWRAHYDSRGSFASGYITAWKPRGVSSSSSSGDTGDPVVAATS